MLSVREETTYTFNVQSPYLTARNKERTKIRLHGGKSAWTGCYLLFNKHLGLIYTPMPKADVPPSI